MEDELRSGRPCTSKTDENVTKGKALVRSDRRFRVRMIGSELNLYHQTVRDILTEELDMRKICAKLIQKTNFTNKQKENGRNMCLNLLEPIENKENFFKHVITAEESWIFECNPETKRQISEWHTRNSSSPKKARMSNRKPNPP